MRKRCLFLVYRKTPASKQKYMSRFYLSIGIFYFNPFPKVQENTCRRQPVMTAPPTTLTGLPKSISISPVVPFTRTYPILSQFHGNNITIQFLTHRKH
jgi:hypothetical protein